MDVAAPSDSYSPTIKPINKGVVHRICSGQVILDLSSAVKELVENSLDAGATCIEIALKEYGKDCFQVIDNGSGISPNNFKVLALKHHTSKLADFPDLQSLTTFGFRGEALSSLCVLGNLTVETRSKNESVATHLSYDSSGLLVAEKKTARQIGTTVSVTNLFSSLPVRSKEFTRNIRKEYGKLISLLNAYALIAKGVRFVCTNTAGRSVRSVVLKTQGSGSLKDNIVTLFGMSTFNCLEAVTLCISDSCKVDGFMSKPGQGNGRNMGDRQFFFVNGRPVDMPKVTKLVNEIYRSANSQQHPVAILNFTVPSRACDVNVTPDKRKVFFSDESSILHALREGLQHIYSSSNARYSVNKAEELTKEADGSDLGSPRQKSHMLLKPLSQNWSFRKEVRDDDQMLEDHIPEKTVEADAKDIHDVERMTSDNTIRRDFTLRVHSFKQVEDSRKLTTHGDSITSVQSTLSSSKRIENGTATSRDSRSHSSIVQSSLENFITANKRKHENVTTLLSEVPILRNRTLHLQSKNNNSENNAAVSRSPSPHRVDDSAEADDNRPSKYFGAEEISNNIVNAHSSGGNTCEGEPQVDFKTMSEGVLVEVPSDSSDILLDARKPSSGLKICSNLQFSIQELKLRRQQRLSQLQSSNSICQRTKTERCYAAATLELSQPENEERKAKALAAATTELEKLFRKEDFGRMKVIGQFNLGFIIGKLDHDLFIVDQHAADEKYNFERLSQSTILNIQPLLRPIRLELSPEEEVVASMHMDIIRKNGFALEEDPDAPPGHHFKLKAIPFSKNITFGVEDVKELISTLADGHGECTVIGSYKMDTPDSVCPSRVRGMLASRACRSSVMIGDALGRNEMNRILGHLAKLKSPWNCPHGRPTMRHLVDLTTIYNNNTSQQ